MNRTGKALAMVIPVLLLVVTAAALLSAPGTPVPHGTARHRAQPQSCVPKRMPSPPYFGVSVAAPQQQRLSAFAAAVGVTPTLVEYYTRFGQPFDATKACWTWHGGAVPLIQWNPHSTSLAAIAAGRYDGYLARYAADVRAFRLRVILSFGHEMNGTWWRWGYTHQSPASFIAAWRHIHRMFAAAHARNVTWMWNPNVVSSSRVMPFGPWWPGTRYVDVTALDGYYWYPQQRFASIFTGSLAAIRVIAPGKPVMIAETGTYPGPKMPLRIADLFRGAATHHLAGVVYFDHHGHWDWRVGADPAAAAALHDAVLQYIGGSA